MKQTLIKACWPMLKFFEDGGSAETYKPSHRVALNIIASVFMVLSFGSAWAAVSSGGWGGFFPIVAFFGLGLVGLMVGTLGSPRAVSKIWGSK